MTDPKRSPRAARFVVGIDLGTTNTTASFAPIGGGAIESFAIPQLVAEGECALRPMLPSALYLASEHDVPAGALTLPWAKDDRRVVGVLARRLGARIAGRLVVSAKSWLCHGGVDREAKILPWGGDVAEKISPVAASTAVVAHVRAAWDADHPEAPLASQEVVLTVPASFDEVARELTVRAAEEAGLTRVRLLEEPQAAIYAWIAAHPDWRERLTGLERVLVLDVGGGTTDFSAIAVRGFEDESSGIELERVAVGDHLLLGGDNMDLALARRVTDRHGASGLDAGRWQQLTALCREAKERLLGSEPPESVAISIPGRGRGVVGGAVRIDVVREDVLAEVLEGFFPEATLAAEPQRSSGAGLVEFGLPYAADPGVTRHLAAFLRSSGPAEEVAPDAVLFNGGAVKPAAVRDRVLDRLEQWFGRRPAELAGADLDLAVSRGAVAYGLARRGIGVRITGGAARAYYLGLDDHADAAKRRVLCVVPRGMEEGAEIDVREPDFIVTANEPVRFSVYSSSTRIGDHGGTVVEAAPETLVPLPPMSTVLRFGRSLVSREVPVHLRSSLTETGTLELWCLSRTTDHRWRLAFDLRAHDVAATEESPDDAPPARGDEQSLVIAPERVQAALALLEGCFAGSDVEPVTLGRQLEDALDAGKDSWPIACIRRLWDGLFALSRGRERSPAHEARWLNLAGFFLRPGFGEERDRFRAEQLWRLFEPGLVFANATQSRAEWWTMWKRVAGGLTRAQQEVLGREIRPVLVPEARKRGKPLRWKAGKQEEREIWQVAGALELLEPRAKEELASALSSGIAKGRAGDAEIWAFGRLAARALVYGPANAVIEPDRVARWLEPILSGSWTRPGPTSLAVAQASRRTGDRARDLPPEVLAKVAERLCAAPEGARYARWVEEVVAMDASQQAMVLAESLPSGLRLASGANTNAS